MNVLLEPFSYEYMLNAMWVSAMVGGLCAFLSCYLMLKGWSLPVRRKRRLPEKTEAPAYMPPQHPGQ